MKKIVIVLLTLALLVGLFLPATVMAKTRWSLEGWRISQSKWTDGKLKTYYECSWVYYRLMVFDYDGTTPITVQHDYQDGKGNFGIDGAEGWFIGPQTDSSVSPYPYDTNIPVLYDEADGIFSVDGPDIELEPDGTSTVLEYDIVITSPGTLIGEDFAIYWKAHCSMTGAPNVSFPEIIPSGSSHWSGASLHTHTSVTGRQDVPIATPPEFGANPSIDVEKEVLVDPASNSIWDDADSPTGPTAHYCVRFRYIVTNTGDVTLTNITLEDSDFGYISVPEGKETLPNGETFTVYYPSETTSVSAESGQQDNIATATGYYAEDPCSDEDYCHYFGDLYY